MEEVEKFIREVIDMRKYQKEYFKTKNTTTLRFAKDMERRVDSLLKAYQDTKKKKSNPTLF